ncbi:Protein of unknown function [Gryllus bimaculatus]|nr:Protein of unknown function [Gryllus bimaculatus]
MTAEGCGILFEAEVNVDGNGRFHNTTSGVAESAVPYLPAVVAGCKQKHPVSMKPSGVNMRVNIRRPHPLTTSGAKSRVNELTKVDLLERRLMGADVASIDLTGLMDDDEDDAFDA